ncbi:MAG TPA: GH116 family glycosyl-hydrolase [Acidobacteriaceae bacterium]|jgi:uncharacterized protein (DUF608 family)|nr:GH116 family glycosyl-hydrolase [Acidobacteriaceae bacterium]
MKRRDFLKTSVLGIASASATTAAAAYLPHRVHDEPAGATEPPTPDDPEKVFPADPHRLFPDALPSRQWARFNAEGFSDPACGIVYRRADVVPHGMPLGGVATGYMDIDTDGTFGFFNLFNSAVPTRGPIQHGFLGISSDDRTWVFTTRDVTGTENAADIQYWGHFPVADLEYQLDGPFQAGLRAWAPFIPGDSRASTTPAAIFEVRLRNQSSESRKVTLGFSFPGPTQAEAQISATSDREMRYVNGFPISDPVANGTIPSHREEITEESFRGLLVRSPFGTEYVLGVLGDATVRFGSQLWIYGYDYATGQQWANMQHRLPDLAEGDFSASMAVDFELGAGEEKTLPIVVAWYSPIWKGDKTNSYARMYTKQYKGARDVAAFIANNHEALQRRVLAWQQSVYSADSYPVWLREGLVNILHLIPKTSYWAVAQAPLGSWCKEEDGLYGMSECPRECPQIECIPCSFYGNIPVVYFFPDLALSTLRGYKAYQYENGAPPWIFGGCTGGAAEGYSATDPCDMATPSPGYQNTLNGPCYVDMLDRYWQRTGDDAILQEFYPSIKKAVTYTIGLRSGAEGIVAVPAGDRNPTQPHTPPGGGLDWFEGNGWFGMTPHVGGIHLAMLRMAERMARHTGDNAFADQCRNWIEEGSKEMESKLWAGDYYLAYYEPETGKRSDLVFGYQLDGDWMAKYHGLPGVFQADRATAALKKIQQTCVTINRYGAANFAKPSASPANPKDFAAWGSGYGAHGYFPPEVYMLGATYLYDGDRATGTEIIRTCQEGISAKYGYTWTQPNVVSGDTGKRIYGSDYYQNMMLWIVPAALDGQDLKKAAQDGGLIAKVLRAGKLPEKG